MQNLHGSYHKSDLVGRTGHFENEMGFFYWEFSQKTCHNDHCVYYLGIGWSSSALSSCEHLSHFYRTRVNPGRHRT